MKPFSKLTIICFSVFLSLTVFAQDQDAMMKEWQMAMTPGAEHKMLSNVVGEWEGDISMWMDPTQPPQISKGTVKYESIFDGRYIIGKFSGKMMDMPFSGMELSGYDNIKKVYFSNWIDNMGTGILYVEGTYDKNSNTFNYTGETVDPSGNKMKVSVYLGLILLFYGLLVIFLWKCLGLLYLHV